MNWTGGHLSRRARRGAKASLNTRQKAHFAKVQNKHRRQSSLEPRRIDREESQPPHCASQHNVKYNRHVPRQNQYRPIEPQHSRQPTSMSVKQECAEDDLYSATPPPREKRKRESHVSDGPYDEEKADWVAEKRRSLLEKRDWVGITYQRPLQLAFASPKHIENVGRRRKITDGHRAQYSSRQFKLDSPFMTRTRPRSPPNRYAPGHRGKTDVMIRIGGRFVPPGISSSTVPSRESRGHSSHQHARSISQVASSDVMLLDNEDVPSSVVPRILKRTPYKNRLVAEHDSGLYDQSHLSAGFYGEEVDGGNESELCYVRDRQHILDEKNSTPSHYHYSSIEAQKMHTTDSIEQSISPIWGTTFASFSPASIKQPIPQSSRVSSVLRSGSSEIAHSNIAQVGKVRPIVPSSQVLDNEIWETWMAPLSRVEENHNEADGVGIDASRPIGPGISTVPTHKIRHPTPRRKLTERYATKFEVPNYEESETASKIVSPSIGESFHQDYTYPGEQRTTRSVLHPESANRSKMRKVEDRPRNIEDRSCRAFKVPSPFPRSDSTNYGRHIGNPGSGTPEGEGVAQPQRLTTSTKEHDPDEIWKAFVFGSDEVDDTEHIYDSGLSLGLDKKTLNASPVLGNTSIDVPDRPSRGNRITPSHFDSTLKSTSPHRSPRQCRINPNHSISTIKYHTPNTIVSNADTTSSEMPWNPPTGVPVAMVHLPPDGSINLYAFDDPPCPSQSPFEPLSNSFISSSKIGPELAPMYASSSSEPLTSKSSDHQPRPSPRPRKVLFTKPKRFEGIRSVPESSQAEEEPLYIGCGLAREIHYGKRRNKERDSYSLIDSDEIESIEDD